MMCDKISVTLTVEDWQIVVDSLEFKKILGEAMIIDKSTSDYEAENLKSEISAVQGVLDKISSEVNIDDKSGEK